MILRLFTLIPKVSFMILEWIMIPMMIRKLTDSPVFLADSLCLFVLQIWANPSANPQNWFLPEKFPSFQCDCTNQKGVEVRYSIESYMYSCRIDEIGSDTFLKDFS